MKKIKYLLVLMAFVPMMLHAQFILNNGISINNTQTLFTNGDWVNEEGSSLRNDGTIITTDNWINNGTLDPNSNGGFVLRYNENKNFRPGSSIIAFLRKEGTANAIFIGSFTVRDSINLAGGLLFPESDAFVLEVAEGALVSNAPGSFLDGTMLRSGTGNLYFPVGKAGNYLPITFRNVSGTNPAIEVRIENAPVGYTAGAGIDALIDFPYVWISDKSNVSDTALYVQIEYPSSLPNSNNVVVARKETGLNRYEGMGTRSYQVNDGIVRVVSYSRGLEGTFTIAEGFPGNLKADSLTLVEWFTQSNGDAWTKKNNWTTGSLSTWEGITQTAASITSINLENANITGPMPATVADILALQSVNISNNNVTSIPNFSGLSAITLLNVSNNRLDFASLEPNVGVTGINYANQKPIGTASTELLEVGSNYMINANVGGTQNNYTWRRNGQVLDGVSTNTYAIENINRSNMGRFEIEVTNSLVPNLTLQTLPQNVFAVANISGRLFADEETTAASGKITLFRVTNSGSYDTTRIQNVSTDGTFILDRIILDDYLLLGQADTLVYDTALPTWYTNTILWEEADTLFLNANITGLDIISQQEPTEPLRGPGVIFGSFEEDIPDGSRIEERVRVSNAAVIIRRVERTTRGEEELVTVSAYVYTNSRGEFFVEGLDPGTYRINIQYPGFPMDPNSFVEFTIGTGVRDATINVAALVVNNKINVRQLIITGIEGREAYRISVYPNPTSEILNIEFDKVSDKRSINILDAQGKSKKTFMAPGRAEIISVTDLPSGLYILQVNDHGRRVKTVKLLIK